MVAGSELNEVPLPLHLSKTGLTQEKPTRQNGLLGVRTERDAMMVCTGTGQNACAVRRFFLGEADAGEVSGLKVTRWKLRRPPMQCNRARRRGRIVAPCTRQAFVAERQCVVRGDGQTPRFG